MKIQISTEYLIIVSFSLLVLIPIALFMYDYSLRQQKEHILILANEAVKKIGEAADYVYLQGEPSRILVKVIIPKDLEEIEIKNRTIIFKVRTYGGITDIYYNTIGEIRGIIPKEPGEYYILVQAKEGGIYLNVSTS